MAVQQDISPTLRRKVCEVVAEVARFLIDDDGNNQWPDFLQFLFQCANSQNAGNLSFNTNFQTNSLI